MKYAFTLLALAAGCSKTNPYYCEDSPDHNCMLDAGTEDFDSESFRCTGNDDCSGATPACASSGACVACTATDIGACAGATPVCETTTSSCRACAANTECASGACMPDGTCAQANTLLFAGPSAAGSTCTSSDKCSLDAALAAADTTKKIIVLDAGTYLPTATLSIAKQVTLLGRDAVISRNSVASGPVIDVTSGGDLTLLYATLSNGYNASTGHGINCTTAKLVVRGATIKDNQAIGVSSTACDLTIDRTTFTANQRGGIYIGGTSEPFSVTNSMLFQNGAPAASYFGGVKIMVTAPSSSSRLEFNTIVDNYAATGSSNAGGIVCDNFVAPHNIVARNTVNGSATDGNQAFGNCTYGDSKLQATTAGLSFLHDSAPYNLRIGADSSAKDASGVTSAGYDFEGDARPQAGVDDIGADEYKP